MTPDAYTDDKLAADADFTVVIPARFASSRLPGKPLADIAGKPMVQHVYQRARASNASRVIVATDDERIMKVVQDFGGEVCMTLAGHPSGTDRLQEVASIYGMADDEIIVNVQGDEPMILPALINQVAVNLKASPMASAATLSNPLVDIDQVFDPNVVKVVADAQGHALYFSRAPIPWARDDFAAHQRTLPAGICFQRHIGIYAYRVGLLNQYVTWDVCPLEQLESLEQLRLMFNGQRIHVAQAVATPHHGVDTEQDLQAVRALLVGQEAQQVTEA